jgi:uncharacterized protein (DUF433 family)
MPISTLRTWFFGYHSNRGLGDMLPVIKPADPKNGLLSFVNLVEAHVLLSIRRDYEISLPKVRKSLSYIERTIGSKNPLAQNKFQTDGRDLFVQHYGKLIDATLDGQTAMAKVIETYLRRIEWDKAGLAKKLFPYILRGVPESEQPKSILIDPTISGGRPVLAGTGIATRVVAERYLAGESSDALAKDYNRTRAEIDEILRCEIKLAA